MCVSPAPIPGRIAGSLLYYRAIDFLCKHHFLIFSFLKLPSFVHSIEIPILCTQQEDLTRFGMSTILSFTVKRSSVGKFFNEMIRICLTEDSEYLKQSTSRKKFHNQIISLNISTNTCFPQSHLSSFIIFVHLIQNADYCIY